MTAEPILSQIKQAARVLFRPRDVIEVRVPKAGRGTLLGYFSDHDRMAQELVRLNARKFPGVYWTLNPVHPDALARADHKTAFAKTGDGTSDHEIVCRRWLLLDFDPKRLTGISLLTGRRGGTLSRSESLPMQVWIERCGVQA